MLKLAIDPLEPTITVPAPDSAEGVPSARVQLMCRRHNVPQSDEVS